MFNLFRKKAPQARPSTGGRLVYAVGDVHGRLDLLGPLLRDIAEDALASQPAERPLLVMLGDYVDRGPDSKGVVDLLLQMRTYARLETRTLKGNHEEALLRFLDDPMFGATWLDNGGGPTLASYGVQPPASRTDPEAWATASRAFSEALSDQHRAFYEGLELMVTQGDYAFVHAGVRPGVAIEAQAERDLLWIRQEFLEAAGPFGKVIVHGHTPSEEAQLTRHRLGVDTGAYATGVLTAVRLEGEDQRLMQSRARRPHAA
ncbi:metallophosphoesterase family protein [Phenylobacterium sp.]|uniref:metallophosphoesterase family protein n=1 Tax=Phenylobacterium sp. TaxID=1871053 RepID=UPI0028114AFA|nr:metallophosphoesterase family protein [Phenylobacterium sp.]